MKAVVNAKIITDGKVLEGYNLLFSDNKIVEITKEFPLLARLIDAKGLYLSAGFIDIHIHGSAGYDVMDATPRALDKISKSILQTGTTSFLATTMTMSREDIKKALVNIERFLKLKSSSAKHSPRAKILGVHLEGPFINIEKKGAQNADYIQVPNFELIEPFMDIIKMITIAPEVDWAREFIFYLQKHYPHVILSIGHSNATYEQSKKSFDWGISHATHLFNAMNPLHHREPAVVGAVLEEEHLSCDIIADLIHIHPSFFKLLYRLKKEQLILITDAMRAGCLSNGVSEIGGQRVVVRDGEARLEDGTLAGSVLKLNEALRNFYRYTDISIPELVAMVTSIPARKLGLEIGELKEGYPADLVLFDEDFNIKKCFVEGEAIILNME
jgi:N-acetylglucosamine-6-phosphate deacetylase